MAKMGAVIIRECCYLSMLLLHLFRNQFSVQGKATFLEVGNMLMFMLMRMLMFKHKHNMLMLMFLETCLCFSCFVCSVCVSSFI